MNKADTSKSMGRGMIYIAWILFLGLLTYVFNHYLEQQNNPNQTINSRVNKNSTEIKLRQNRYGHYVVNGKINNNPVTFLLDTGATLISIPEVVASQLQLEKAYAMKSRTANGTIEVFGTQLDSVSIGAIELTDIRATINPYMEGNEILLGMSFLKHLEIIQKGKTLILRY